MHQVLGDFFLGGHVGDAGQGEHCVGSTGFEQGAGQLQGVRCDHVVVGQTVDQQQRRDPSRIVNLRRVEEDVAALVVLRLGLGVTIGRMGRAWTILISGA